MTSPDAFQLVGTWVDARREELVSLCARLVEAESVNPPGETRRAVAVLEDFFSGEGVAFERIARVAAKPTLAAGIDDYTEEQDVIDCAKVYALAALEYLSGN